MFLGDNVSIFLALLLPMLPHLDTFLAGWFVEEWPVLAHLILVSVKTSKQQTLGIDLLDFHWDCLLLADLVVGAV